MIEASKILLSCCSYLNLSKQEATWVLQILSTVKERQEMIEWMRQNIMANPDPVEVIIAAAEIQMKHRS